MREIAILVILPIGLALLFGLGFWIDSEVNWVLKRLRIRYRFATSLAILLVLVTNIPILLAVALLHAYEED
jgi:hypothetical protein